MKKLLVPFLLLPFLSFAQIVNIDFKVSELYTLGAGPGNIVAAFFDSDTIMDLAIADYNSNNVAIMIGNGDTTFKAVNAFSVGYPVFIVAGHFNADTNSDVAVAIVDNQNYYVNIFLGAGDGSTFTSTDTNYTLGGPPKWMVGADFNNDGITDLATANSSSNAGTISILQGKSGSGFLPAVTYNAGTYPSSLAACDFNKDGFSDIAVTNLGDNTVSVFLFDTSGGNSNGIYMQFVPQPVNYHTGANPWSIDTSDFNRDSYIDLVVSNSGGDSISIFYGTPDNSTDTTFALQATNYVVGGNPWSVIAADFNGDNYPDIAVTSRDSGLTVLQGMPTGGFIKAWNYSDTLVNYAPLYFPLYLIAQDINSDKLPDIILSNHSKNNVVVLKDTLYPRPAPTAVISPYSSIGSSVKVYPVPATELLHVDCKYKIMSLSLCDIQGKALISSTQTFITVNSLPAGIYLLYINTEKGTIVKQVAVTTE